VAEFQNRRAQQDLTSALTRLGLKAAPGPKNPSGAGAALGPGETAPATLGEIPSLGPSYLPPAPADPVPTVPLEPPPGK